jgi:predicted phosphohydrolase
MNRTKYLWLTDTHLRPWSRKKLIDIIMEDKPRGIFLTGDISYGLTLFNDLEFLVRYARRPIYFVLGNHDYHFSSIKKTHEMVRLLCNEYKNLIWMTDAGVERLTDEVAIIGTEGWYDALLGNKRYIKYTLDWPLIKELRNLSNFDDRIDAIKELAKQGIEKVIASLELAIEDYKTIYLLTHFPPWPEATRDVGTLMEKFWLPYNVNLTFGKELEKVMQNHKKRNLIVLSGHTHTDCWIHVSRNIECRVNKASYFGDFGNEEHIYI